MGGKQDCKQVARFSREPIRSPVVVCHYCGKPAGSTRDAANRPICIGCISSFTNRIDPRRYDDAIAAMQRVHDLQTNRVKKCSKCRKRPGEKLTLDGRWLCLKCMNYVKPTRIPEKNRSPGRNFPCPCGSGKKAKKCCYS